MSSMATYFVVSADVADRLSSDTLMLTEVLRKDNGATKRKKAEECDVRSCTCRWFNGKPGWKNAAYPGEPVRLTGAPWYIEIAKHRRSFVNPNFRAVLPCNYVGKVGSFFKESRGESDFYLITAGLYPVQVQIVSDMY